MSLGLFIAALLAAPQAVPVQNAPAAQSDPRVAERAHALARLLNSDANIIGDDASDQKALAMVPELFGANPELAALEKEHPGIALEIAKAMLPIINRSARERLPQLWDRQAALYSRHFSAAELDKLIAFYSSPTGIKLIRVMFEKLQPRRMLEEAKKSEDFTFSGSAAVADIRAAAPGVAEAMNAEDQRVLLALMATGLLPKLQKLGPETQQITITWMNESAPWEDAEAEKAVVKIIDSRMEASE